MATATTTTATLNVVSLHGAGNYTGPACIILNTAGATLSQVQQQHQHLLVNPRNDQDYLQHHRLQQQQQLPQHQQTLDPHQNNNNNNFNINNIGTATNNGTVVGVVSGVGELVGLVGVGPSVVNVPPCPTTTSATVTPTVLAPTDTSTASTAALALRLGADPSVTIPAVLRSINPPAPITTNVTSSNVILNVSRILNNQASNTTSTTTTTTTNNNNNHNNNNNNNINCKNYNFNTNNNNNNNNNLASDNNNNNGSHVDQNIKKLKIRTTCQNGLLDLHSQHHLLPTLQQAYQQHPTQHQPELLRCKRRIDFSGLGFTLPRAQPAAVARRNERERNRVKLVNLGFEALREHVPSGRKNKKMSKVETLRAAVQYIKNLQDVLQHEPDFMDIADLEACAAVASAAAAHLTSSTCVAVAQSQMTTSVSSTSISPPPNSDISCSPSSSLCSDSGSSCDPFIEDDLIDFSRLL